MMEATEAYVLWAELDRYFMQVHFVLFVALKSIALKWLKPFWEAFERVRDRVLGAQFMLLEQDLNT